MKAANWIDRVKAAKGLTSDYAAAKALEITTSTVSWYRRVADKTLDEDTAVKVAHALEINPALVLADQAMERAKNEEARSAWGAVMERLGGMAVSILLGAGMLVGLGASPDAQAKARYDSDSKPSSTLYTSYKVQRRNKRRARRGYSVFNQAAFT